MSVDWLLYSVFKLSRDSLFVQSLNFFIYDSIKIILLLLLMITLVGILRSYISAKQIKGALSRQKYGLGNITASGFGAITPFCSCSSVPLFLSFVKAGVPLGITFSFLITSPLVNEYLVVLMLGFFGWKLTTAYVLFGILLGVVGGIVLGKLHLEKHLESDIVEDSIEKGESFPTFKSRVHFGLNESFTLIKKLWAWILFGVAIGAVIHNYVPQDWIQGVLGSVGAFAVPLAVLIGVPMYGSCAAIVPIAVALFQKGVPIGTALAFMMAISALSFPEAVILRRAMKLRLILIFFGIVALGMILGGYLLNWLQPYLVL